MASVLDPRRHYVFAYDQGRSTTRNSVDGVKVAAIVQGFATREEADAHQKELHSPWDQRLADAFSPGENLPIGYEWGVVKATRCPVCGQPVQHICHQHQRPNPAIWCDSCHKSLEE